MQYYVKWREEWTFLLSSQQTYLFIRHLSLQQRLRCLCLQIYVKIEPIWKQHWEQELWQLDLQLRSSVVVSLRKSSGGWAPVISHSLCWFRSFSHSSPSSSLSPPFTVVDDGGLSSFVSFVFYLFRSFGLPLSLSISPSLDKASVFFFPFKPRRRRFS